MNTPPPLAAASIKIISLPLIINSLCVIPCFKLKPLIIFLFSSSILFIHSLLACDGNSRIVAEKTSGILK